MINTDDILKYNEYYCFNKSLLKYISSSALLKISFTCIGRSVATTEDPTTTQHDVTTERLITTINDYTASIQNNDIIYTLVCIAIVALLIIIASFIIVYLIVLLVLRCTGRVTCILLHAFHKKNTSKTTNQNSNDKHENRQSSKASSGNEHQIYKGDRSDNQFINKSYSVDENGHQSKNKHVVTSDSSQRKETTSSFYRV